MQAPLTWVNVKCACRSCALDPLLIGFYRFEGSKAMFSCSYLESCLALFSSGTSMQNIESSMRAAPFMMDLGRGVPREGVDSIDYPIQ
jgi:hypothetical protein